MHITHITAIDPFDPDIASGTLYQIAKGFKQFDDIKLYEWYIPPPQQLLPLVDEFIFRCKKFWARMYNRAHLEPHACVKYSQHIADVLQKPLIHHKTDAILTALSPIVGAYLDTKIPIVFWTDYIYSAVSNFYPDLRFRHPDAHWDNYIISDAALHNAKLLIFSSEWAARSAIELHGMSKNKIRIVPFGANIEVSHTLSDIKKMIRSRSRECIKFLFVGKDWYRKGGSVVLKIAEELHATGRSVEVTIVGCTPNGKQLPPYVKLEKLLSKKNNEDVTRLMHLYQETHFLFVPSRAETFGIVFCEANAFGVPCITTHVGGISEVVKDGINGMKFSLETTVKQYCDYIVNLMDNYSDYEELALSAFNEYETRLNWQVAISKVKALIAEVI